MGQARQRLILIPGSLCDERVWQHQAAALASRADIAIPSLHGHAGIPDMARSILSEIEGRFAVCGFAMGGRVALEIFMQAPDRVARIALLDTSIHPVAAGEAARRQPQLDLAQRDGMAALARWWYPQIANPASLADPAFMALLEAMACTFTADDYAREVGALLNRPDPRDSLARIAVPALVLAGVNDPLSTPDRNRAIADAIPNATLRLIDDCWHFPMLEHPAIVTDALRDWLSA